MVTKNYTIGRVVFFKPWRMLNADGNLETSNIARDPSQVVGDTIVTQTGIVWVRTIK